MITSSPGHRTLPVLPAALAAPGLNPAPDAIPGPWVVEFQTVSNCNARCVVCPSPALRGQPGERVMSDRVWTRLLDDLEDLQPRRVIPYLNNEPLLDRGLEERIRAARGRVVDPEVEVSTNGALLTRDRAASLFQAGVTELLVSVFGHDAESHRRIMGLDYERTRRNVEGALQARAEVAPTARVAVVLLVMPGVPNEVRDEQAAGWETMGAEVERYGYLDRAANVTFDVEGGPQRDPCIPPRGCELNRHRERSYVLTDGTILFCCHDWRREFPVGNIEHTRLRALWESNAYAHVRRQVEGEAPSPADFLCRRCKLSPEAGA